MSLASGPDGSLYVGDYNLIRKISPQGVVTTILQFRWARLVLAKILDPPLQWLTLHAWWKLGALTMQNRE